MELDNSPGGVPREGKTGLLQLPGPGHWQKSAQEDCDLYLAS